MKVENQEKVVTLKEATREVETAITRLALLHLSYSKVLTDEFGEKKGSELVVKSIIDYGRRITEHVKKGGADLPKWGVYSGEVFQDNEGRHVVTGCNLATIFKQFNELHLGRLYCYVDAAKSMASDPLNKLIHLTCEACGDDCCTFQYVPTTEEERENHLKSDPNWKNVDPRLTQNP
ncbi:MAG: hypothetical protein ACXAC8_05000 [Candidatus Hodarchaeales archaeon]|jgi:hypothetical protein